MQLPKYSKRNAASSYKMRVCKECGKEYFGHPISKYCPFHQNPDNRKRPKRVYPPDTVNQKLQINHPSVDLMKIDLTCALPGCNKKFRIIHFNKQEVYPRYCEEHRNAYKRLQFLRLKRKARKK